MKEDLHSHRDTWSVVEQLAELFSTSCGSGICVGQTCDFAPTPVFPWYLSLMEPIPLNIIPLRSQCHLRTVSSDHQFSWRLQLSSDISLSSVLFYTLSVNGDTGPPIWRLLKPFIVFDCERALAPRPDLFSCHVSGRFWGVWAASCVASVFIKEDRESTPGSAEWFWIFSVRNTGELLLAQETAGDKVTSKYRHMWIDIRSLDFDMFYFSGSKCTGTGVCVGFLEWLQHFLSVFEERRLLFCKEWTISYLCQTELLMWMWWCGVCPSGPGKCGSLDNNA